MERSQNPRIADRRHAPASRLDVSNPAQVGQEVDVDFPGNVSGKGRADYVLWGDNGQPLAVIEAKKSGNLSL